MIQNKIKIADDVYMIGKIDTRDVPFHRLVLTKGTTYNSYLIDAEKPAIIDTVDISFGREYVESLSRHINPEKIEYIVINHVEPDHSGGLPALAAKAKNAVIVCTEIAVNELKQMYNLYNREFLTVKDGDKLNLGNKTLQFIVTPWLHTEETMITNLLEDQVLFTCDIFSTHLANNVYFEDAADFDITEDYITYYNLIMHPHRRHVREMLSMIKDTDIKVIAPSHGYVLRRSIADFIDIYAKGSSEALEAKKAVVLYSSMTGNTRKLANSLKEGLELDGIKTSIFKISKTDTDQILKAVTDADLILAGTATKYADMVGDTEELIGKLADMDLQGKTAAAFGSFGWSGEGIEHLQDMLGKTNMKVLNTSDIIKTTGVTDVAMPMRIRFLPEDETQLIISRTTNYLSGLLLGA